MLCSYSILPKPPFFLDGILLIKQVNSIGKKEFKKELRSKNEKKKRIRK
jgi:hypothetical protein